MTEATKSDDVLDAETTNQISGGTIDCSHIAAAVTIGTGGNGLVGAATYLACEFGGPASDATQGMSDVPGA